VSKQRNQPCFPDRGALSSCDEIGDEKPDDHEDPKDGDMETKLRFSEYPAVD